MGNSAIVSFYICGFTICNKSVGDFNLRADPVSVNQLIQQVPQLMFFVPFQQILDYTLNMEQLGSYYGGTEAQRWMARRTNEWFKQWTSIFTCEDYIHIWDTTPVLVGSGIVEPRFCNFVQISASVEQCDNTTKLFRNRPTLRVDPFLDKCDQLCQLHLHLPSIQQCWWQALFQ